jgi:hypothetical protein
MIDLEFDRSLCLALSDLVPESIATLTFQTDEDAGIPIAILIRNLEIEVVITGKTTDSDGKFSIQVLATNTKPSDVPSNFFKKDAGLFFFKLFANEEPIVIEENEAEYEGVSLRFIKGYTYVPDYIIELTTGTVVVPPDEEGGLGFDTLNGTLILQ